MDANIQAIQAHDPKTYDIHRTHGNYYVARIGLFALAYYEVIDGKIVGDVWYE